MPSIRSTLRLLALMAPALTSAAPAGIGYRQESAASSAASATETAAASSTSAAETAPTASPPAAAPATGGDLSDIDILQFALTAEHLESAFYKEGFAKFPAADFLALGLKESDIKSLQNIGQTEATHVTTLLSVISAAGAKPVEPCVYNFDAAFADAATMVATARVLEAIGVSAYLGAAPLVTSSDVLAAAASIVTVEARHNALIRVLSGAEAVPAAFDVALGPRAVFTLAAPFIKSCPDGSNLNIAAFPSISLLNPEQAQVGQNLKLADPGNPAGAAFCAFVAAGGNQFEPLVDGNCVVPQNLEGEVYMMITKSKSVADSEVLAGPSVIQPS